MNHFEQVDFVAKVKIKLIEKGMTQKQLVKRYRLNYIVCNGILNMKRAITKKYEKALLKFIRFE